MFSKVSQMILLFLVALLLYQSNCASGFAGLEGSSSDGPPIILRHFFGKNTHEHNNLQFIKNNERISMICISDRNASCVWMKDGSPINLNCERVQGLFSKNGSGKIGLCSLVVNAKADTAGSYYCQCSNALGIAVSPITRLQLSVLEAFHAVSDPPVHKLSEGAPLRLSCNSPLSLPRGEPSWALSKKDSTLQYIDFSARIQQDYQGNLYFANTVVDDNYPSSRYVCVVHNSDLQTSMMGNDQILDVSASADEASKEAYQEPVLQWSSPKNDVAVEGTNKALKCIFSGYPTPDVTWTRADGPLDNPRVSITLEGHGTEISINNLTYSDAGIYRCTARTSNSSTPVFLDLNLTVEASPRWMPEFPERRRTEIEDTPAEFICPAEGLPAPIISWSINGRPVVENERIRIDNGTLKYSKLIKSDTQVLQCSAANSHGEILTNFALTVLAVPPNSTDVEEGSRVNLPCRSDGIPSPNNKDSENASVSHSGSYQCRATNIFGHDEHQIWLRVMATWILLAVTRQHLPPAWEV